MALYAQVRTAVHKLLKTAGQELTLTRVIEGAYDTATSSAATTTSTQTGIGAIFDRGDKDIDGTLIRVGDKQLILSPLNSDGVAITAPQLGDTVTTAAVDRYTVEEPLKELNPGGTVVAYDCNLRK